MVSKKKNIDIPPEDNMNTSTWEWLEKFSVEYLIDNWLPVENNDWEIVNLRERRKRDDWLRYEVEWDWEAVKGNSEEIGTTLTPVQELFCHYYCNNEVTRFNAVMSYAEAYWYNLDGASRLQVKDKNTGEVLRESEYRRMYRVCWAAWNRLLKNVKIQDRITVLLNQLKKDEIVDRRMMEHILSKDNQSSRDMIKEYNKLMQRITDKTKDESESDKAKAELYKSLESQIKTMPKEQVSQVIQDLLTPKK